MIEALSPELTVAWTIFAVWCLVQFAWYRQVRVGLVVPPPPRRSDSAKRVPVAKRTMPALPTGGSPECPVDLGLAEPALEPKPSARFDRGSVYQ